MDGTSAICTPGLLHRPLRPCRFLTAVLLLCSNMGQVLDPHQSTALEDSRPNAFDHIEDESFEDPRVARAVSA